MRYLSWKLVRLSKLFLIRCFRCVFNILILETDCLFCLHMLLFMKTLFSFLLDGRNTFRFERRVLYWYSTSASALLLILFWAASIWAPFRLVFFLFDYKTYGCLFFWLQYYPDVFRFIQISIQAMVFLALRLQLVMRLLPNQFEPLNFCILLILLIRFELGRCNPFLGLLLIWHFFCLIKEINFKTVLLFLTWWFSTLIPVEC